MIDRNPYVLLGLPFGSSRDQANIAFARRAKPYRRRPDSKEKLVELTWALNQIDEVIKDHQAAIDLYRIPADPDAFDPDGQGVFRPPPEPLERQQPPSGPYLDAFMKQVTNELLASAVSAYSRSCRPPPV